jgi:hypothetical protein
VGWFDEGIAEAQLADELDTGIGSWLRTRNRRQEDIEEKQVEKSLAEDVAGLDKIGSGGDVLFG